jgi:hypothetical protein
MLNWIMILSKPTKGSIEVMCGYLENSRRAYKEEIMWMAVEWKNCEFNQSVTN